MLNRKGAYLRDVLMSNTFWSLGREALLKEALILRGELIIINNKSLRGGSITKKCFQESPLK